MFLIPPTEIDTTSCRLHLSAMAHDYDWVIVGSGFGGSVSALRLAEKGYKVAVIEVGRRFEDKDFAKTAWNLRRYFWLPKFGLRGIMRMSMFKDVNVVSGCGVGAAARGAPAGRRLATRAGVAGLAVRMKRLVELTMTKL